VLKYVERRPRAELAGILECVWSVSGRAVAGVRPPERIVPDGCPELILHRADPFARKVGTRWVVQPRIFLAGTLTRPWLLRAGRRVDTLGLRFRPGTVASVFGVSMHTMADAEVPLSRLVSSRAAAALRGAVARARTRPRAMAAAEAWLVPHATGTPPRPRVAQAAVEEVLRTRGLRRIDDVARTLGWTRRRLERAFAHDLGIRPKMFARIVRLNAVLAELDHEQRGDVVDLALSAGYFDQSHLLRDFRALAGRRPRESRHADGEMARHFTDPRRLRVLLSGE
jgi:AraC-like DNA-binding protein